MSSLLIRVRWYTFGLFRDPENATPPLMKRLPFFSKANLLILLLALFCLIEVAQAVDFSRPLLPSFEYDPFNEFHVLRRDFLCAKTELLKQKVDQVYFLPATQLAQRDLFFESYYVSYILNPEILVTGGPDSLFAVTVVEPENVKQLLRETPYTLVLECGNSRVVVLKKK